MPIRWYGPSLILLVTVVVVMLVGPGLARKIVWNYDEAKISQARNELLGDADLVSLSDSFSKVSTLVEPSVVHVQTFGPTASGGGGFFSRFDPLPQTGNGSGWVYQHPAQDGKPAQNFILTNHHVVVDAQEIRVRFADGSTHVATLVNSDPLTDVAVLRVPDAFLHPAALSPDPVQKGQIVFAFGSPFRFDFSVSQGIVSASGRQLEIMPNSNKYQDFIQTDAAINPGNSGGPLTDIYGRVVGMNTAIASTRSAADSPGGFMGLGFAIPVEMAVDVATRIIEEGTFHRGFLGVHIVDVTPALASSFGVDGVQGVLVEHVIRDGPSADSGLQPGDIITHVEQLPVNDMDELRYTVAGHAPGKPIEVTAIRQGQPQRFTVSLGELPPEPVYGPVMNKPMFMPSVTHFNDTLRELGILRLADFTQDHARDEGWRPAAGVMIMQMRGGSLADAQRLGVYTLITAVNDLPIETFAQLEQAYDALPDPQQPVRLTTLTWSPRLNDYITRFALMDTSGNR